MSYIPIMETTHPDPPATENIPSQIQQTITADGPRIAGPWYLSKIDPSFAGMLTALRHTIIAARFMSVRPAQPTHTEIRQVQRAWALAAA